MKKNKLIIIVAVALSLLALYLVINTTKGTLSEKESNFSVIDTASISKIFLTDKSNNKVLLERTTTESWQLNGIYKAESDVVNTLLKTIMRLEVAAPVAKSARNNIIKRIAAIGVKTEIYQKVYRINIFGIKLFQHEKLVKTYYVGDATQNLRGTYMLLEGADNPYIIHIPGFNGFLTPRYSALESDWRSHILFQHSIADIKSVQIEFPENHEQSYRIENIGQSKFKLISLQKNVKVTPYDTIKLFDFLSGFDLINFETLIKDKKVHNIDSITSTTPFHIITLTDMSDKTTKVKTFHKKASPGETELDETPSLYDKDRLYALFNDDKDIALIQFYAFDKILRPLNYFLMGNTLLKQSIN